LERLDTLARRFSVGGILSSAASGYVVAGVAPAAEVDAEALADFRQHMDDDLDTPGALAGIFELVTAAHTAADGGEADRAQGLAVSAAVLAAALGLDFEGGASEVDPDSARLVAERDAARAARDFARADALRDELTAMGWTVEDTPGGTAVRR
jgi:cysteinyl-tRNA synthetase